VKVYAIKIPYPDGDEWLTEGDSKFQLRIKTFEEEDEAYLWAHKWSHSARVIEIDDDSDLKL